MRAASTIASMSTQSRWSGEHLAWKTRQARAVQDRIVRSPNEDAGADVALDLVVEPGEAREEQVDRRSTFPH